MSEKKGMGIIFHGASPDRLQHGLSIALAALALGREVKVFFTYWSLFYLKKGSPPPDRWDREAEPHREIFESARKKGHLPGFPEMLSQAKRMGAKFYACSNSMGLLNMARDELLEEIDKSMGLITYLVEVSDDQILFI